MMIAETDTRVQAAGKMAQLALLVESSRFHEALDIARLVRERFPRNTFVVALGKQLEKLSEGGIENAEYHRELKASLPSLINRVTESIQHGEAVVLPPAEMSQEEYDEIEKLKAIETVKSHYFELADESLEKGDFEAALAEVHRVLLLDGSDTIAPEYRKKIELLLLSKKAKEETTAPATTRDVPAEPETAPFTPRKASAVSSEPGAGLDQMMGMSKPNFDSIVARAHTKATTFQQTHPSASFKPKAQSAREDTASAGGSAKSRSYASFFLGTGFFIALAIGVSYLMWRSNPPEEAVVPPKPVPAAVPVAAPPAAAEKQPVQAAPAEKQPAHAGPAAVEERRSPRSQQQDTLNVLHF